MRVVLQRVNSAEVKVNGQIVSSVNYGFLLLVGFAMGDTERCVREMAHKISKFRVMDDVDGKMNLNIRDVGGEILSVPQFTLAGVTDHGNRPGFSSAAVATVAKKLWSYFNQNLRDLGIPVKEGVFGAGMKVSLINDGPVTFVLDMPHKREFFGGK